MSEQKLPEGDLSPALPRRDGAGVSGREPGAAYEAAIKRYVDLFSENPVAREGFVGALAPCKGKTYQELLMGDELLPEDFWEKITALQLVEVYERVGFLADDVNPEAFLNQKYKIKETNKVLKGNIENWLAQTKPMSWLLVEYFAQGGIRDEKLEKQAQEILEGFWAQVARGGILFLARGNSPDIPRKAGNQWLLAETFFIATLGMFGFNVADFINSGLVMAEETKGFREWFEDNGERWALFETVVPGVEMGLKIPDGGGLSDTREASLWISNKV